MATGGNVPELGGYDYEFTSKVPEDWECLVCHLTLKDPVQIVGCGHRLCNICMESLLRRPSPTCPADRQPLSREKIFPDAACHRKILDLTVKCSHSGCSWTGELRAVEKHFDICPKFPVPCTNKCGVKDIRREKLEVHLRYECPATEVQCEYKNLGCEEVFPRSDAKFHLQTHIESHLNLALRGLEATQHQFHELVTVVKDQSKQLERQSQQIERQSQQIGRQSEQIERLMSKDKDQSQQIKRQSAEIERQSGEIERLMSKDKVQSKKMERLRSRVQDQSQQIKRLMSKDKEQSEEMERSMSTVQGQRCMPINQIFPTPFEWKIPNARDFLSKGNIWITEHFSKLFYLFKRGYKYLLKIKTHSLLWPVDLGLYIKVIPGEFDELLSWPCKEKVRVTWVDQVSLPSENRSDVIDFEKGREPCFRPLNDDHHVYRLVLDFTVGFAMKDTILIRVNRE